MTAILPNPDSQFGIVISTHNLAPHDLEKVAAAAHAMAASGMAIKSVMFDNPEALPAAATIKEFGLTPIFDDRTPDKESAVVSPVQLAAYEVGVALISKRSRGLTKNNLSEQGIAPVLAVDTEERDSIRGYPLKGSYIRTARNALDVEGGSPARIVVDGTPGSVAEILGGLRYVNQHKNVTYPTAFYLNYEGHIPIQSINTGQTAVRAIVELDADVPLQTGAISAELGPQIEQLTKVLAA